MSEEILNEVLGEPLTEGPKFLGKFASVSDLEKAYESLQAEFTRKSQLLAELQQGQAGAAKIEIPNVEPKTEINRDEIIKEYLTSVATRPNAPTVIAGTNDLAYGVKPETKSIRDLTKVAENYFKTKEI